MPRIIKGKCHGKNGRILKKSSCYKKGTKKRKTKKRVAVILLNGGFSLAGSKCRDKQGAFVPVAQCRRRKKR